MAKHKTLLEITPPSSRLHHVALLLKEKNIVKVAQLAKMLGIVPADIYKIFEGHVFKNNKPGHAVFKRASHFAHLLFPKADFPDDALAALILGDKDLTMDDISHIPVLTSSSYRPKLKTQIAHTPHINDIPLPGRPVLLYSKGKWTLSKPSKT
ncbi:MAG: hypothetical protein K2Q32_01425 [Alphaproteobacteria bacterium]|nr:hypothetical protein [Alphaproteobacteria bacterium]